MTGLVKGEQYRVVKPGARLFWWEPCGPNCQQGAGLTLEVGDVITYDRNAYGGMSDDVYYDYFRKDGKCGQFWPNNWGTADKSFLEPVPAPVGAV
jgi:hypothetical protein